MTNLIKWSSEEEKLLETYFTNKINELALFLKLHELNPERTYEAMCRKLRRMKEDGRVRTKDEALATLRVGYLDIEATNLNANFGYMLSYVIKTKGKNEFKSSVISKKEITEFQFDKKVLEDLLRDLECYDVIYTHYGADRRFDIPFIRTRAYFHNMENLLPKNMEKFIFDTWLIAKNKLRLHNNRLDSIAEACGITNIKKTPLSSKKWTRAALGDEDALKYIYTHNKRDSQLLERIHKKLEVVERPIYRSI